MCDQQVHPRHKSISPSLGRAVVLIMAWSFLLAGEARAQVSLEISQLMLRYRVLSRSAKLDESVRAESRRLEVDMLQARRQGQMGQAYRILQKAISLMEGKTWTPALEFAHSLALVPAYTVADSSRPLMVQIGQRYPAPAEPGASLSARVSLSPPLGRAGGGSRAPAIDLGTHAGFAADLVFEPFRFAVDLGKVEEGQYRLQAEIRNGEQLVQNLESPIHVVRDMDVTRKSIEQRLAKISGFESAKASVRYPFDLAQSLNLGRFTLQAFDFSKGLAESMELLAAIESGKDSFAGATGNLARHYYFPEAGEVMPFRVYVPKSYDRNKACPLIVALHGLGGTESTLLQQGNGVLGKLAEERGWLVAAPLGYRRNGGYGRLAGALTDPQTERMTQLSEKDVLNVLRLVQGEYRIDPQRIYLMGHSMGGNGTWTLGARHAEIWAALAPIASGGVNPSDVPLERLKEHHVPVIVTHGDADQVAPVEISRTMVAQLKKMGVIHEYIEVAGAGHGDVVVPNLPRILEFLSRQARKP
jgi:poly(3-hydroxybutyrate) depolymerase